MTIIRRRADLRRIAWAALLCVPAHSAVALDLALPAGARMTAETRTEAGSYRLPTGPWSDAGIPSERLEGAVTRQAWRVDGQTATTQQIMALLRDQVVADGYEVMLDCGSRACGGFDFRFNTDILPGPDMYVDLADFRFLSARSPQGDGVSLLVSQSEAASFIQIVEVTDAPRAETPAEPSSPAARPDIAAAPTPLIGRLEAEGHAVLRDLQFSSGVSDLGAGPIASLDELAAYLQANDAARITFVGHTDATGPLATNIALSRRRAAAAVSYLRDRHGIEASRLAAEGVGYLAPVSSNLTEAGRQENRRIEAILLGAG